MIDEQLNLKTLYIQKIANRTELSFETVQSVLSAQLDLINLDLVNYECDENTFNLKVIIDKTTSKLKVLDIETSNYLYRIRKSANVNKATVFKVIEAQLDESECNFIKLCNDRLGINTFLGVFELDLKKRRMTSKKLHDYVIKRFSGEYNSEDLQSDLSESFE